jgi:hypothetical protein
MINIKKIILIVIRLLDILLKILIIIIKAILLMIIKIHYPINGKIKQENNIKKL